MSPPPSSSGFLKDHATAFIVTGSVVGFLLVVILAYFIVKGWRRKNGTVVMQSASGVYGDDYKGFVGDVSRQ